MTSGQPGTDEITDVYDETCYTVTKPSEIDVLQHQFILNIDHQGEHFTLLAIIKAGQTAICSLMNIFYTLQEGCELYDRCAVVNDMPGAHYVNTDLVTCSFHCTCAGRANQCAVFANTFSWDHSGWELCELVAQN